MIEMLFYKGRIYIKDFLAELKDQDIEISQAEVKKIMEFSDREGQVGAFVVTSHGTQTNISS